MLADGRAPDTAAEELAQHRLDVRVTFRRSDLWCGHRWVPRWPKTRQEQRPARPGLVPPRPTKSRAPK
eukprot:4729670-Pyramimonas_sp.AAC.1